MEIKLSTVRDVCYNKHDLGNDEWELVESNITGSDEYDGGVDYEAIMRNKTTGDFYKATYQEWDMDWEKSGFEEDEEEFSIDNGQVAELVQVYPKQVTITIYE